MSNKKEKMYQEISEHGENLKTIFGLPAEVDPVKLCKSLLRLENKAHHATTCLCNTNTLHLMELDQYTGYDVKQATETEQDTFFDGIRLAIKRVLFNAGKSTKSGLRFSQTAYDNIVINFDPRGYALKIKAEFCKDKKIFTDWGGYGIIAPYFREVK